MMQKGNLKGFIFTLDAIFSLVVSAVGISILLYANFANPGSFSAPGTQAYGTLQNMLQTSISSLSRGSQYLGALTQYSNISSANWPQYGHDSALSSSAPFSLAGPYLLYTYNLPSNMLPGIAINGKFAYIASGSKIYVINATNGKPFESFPAANPSTIVSDPAFYRNMVFYANSTGFVNAVNVQNSITGWNLSAGGAVTTPLEIENNYLVFGTTNGFYLINPLNGSMIAYASLAYNGIYNPSETPAYGGGEYVVSTSSSSRLNYLSSYALEGSGLVQVWNAPLTASKTTSPVLLNGTIAVGSGSYLYIFSAGGNQITNTNLGAQVIGVSGSGNNYYAQTSNAIYRYSIAGGSLTSEFTQPIAVNSTPTSTQSVIYVSSGNNIFEGYSPNLQKILWNMSLLSNYSSSGSSIELAYGNAYVTAGNTLYAFGTYKPQPNDNLLQALSSMYLNRQGAYASILLSNLYNSTTGIYINNTYAPDLSMAYFNGYNSYISTGTKGLPIGNATRSMFAWVYVTGSGDYVIQSYGTQAATELSLLRDDHGNLYFAGYQDDYESQLVVPQNSWNFVGYTYNGSESVTLYLNGQSQTELISSKLNTILPGSGSVVGEGLSGIGYFQGSIADVQIYNSVLTQQQISQIYQNGAFEPPPSTGNLTIWLPLDGNANDYSGNFNNGIPYKVSYAIGSYQPPRLADAYQISKASTPLVLNNNGTLQSYNVSVVIWR
jgi:hypothetical protein